MGRALALAMGGGLCEMGCGLRRGGYWIRLRGILSQAQSIWDEAARAIGSIGLIGYGLGRGVCVR